MKVSDYYSKRIKKRIPFSELSEEEIQVQIVNYLRAKNILFQTNPYSGFKQSMYSAAKAKRLGHNSGFPDVMIFEPRRGFHGLFIELKKFGFQVFKKNGSLRDEHIKKQNDVIQTLLSKNYYSIFCCGFEQAKDVIDWYFGEDKLV